MPIHWRSQTDIAEDNRYGRAYDDRPLCKICGHRIADDNWRGGPVTGYVCSHCHDRMRPWDLDDERAATAEAELEDSKS